MCRRGFLSGFAQEKSGLHMTLRVVLQKYAPPGAWQDSKIWSDVPAQDNSRSYTDAVAGKPAAGVPVKEVHVVVDSDSDAPTEPISNRSRSPRRHSSPAGRSQRPKACSSSRKKLLEKEKGSVAAAEA